MQRQYKAFISYSWADKEWGAWLHRALELYRPPSKLVGQETAIGPVPQRLHPIFKDREEEAAGHGIGAAIEAALDNSEFLIVLCSPTSAKSQWVNREIAYFKTHKDPTKILALIVEGEPGASALPGREAQECFARALTHKVGPDLQPTDEIEDIPLAADARKSGDGKRGAKLKLAAALIGVGLDDLVQRDERRRTIRRRWIMGGMAGITTAMSGLSFVAVNQRDAAVKAEAMAETAQADAEFQRDEAQDQVEWMLTDLRKRLDAVGRLDILDAVGARLLESYDKQDIATLNPDALGRRARVLLLLGEVDNTKGDLDAALARYEQAAQTTSELLRRDPDNPQRIFDHSQSVFWVGYIAWQRGDAEIAKAYLAQYYDQAQRLVEIDPDNEDYQAELMFAHSNLGTLEMDQGEAASAETNFRAALEISLKLYGDSPTDATIAIDVGQSYSWLAEALYHQAKIREAREAREAELAVYGAVANREEHATLRNRESIAHYSLAEFLGSAGDLDKALLEAIAAADIADEILAKDPGNLEYADRAAMAQAILGEAHMHIGDYSGARLNFRQAKLIAERLVAEDPTNIRWRGVLAARPDLQLALLEEREGFRDVALEIIGPLISGLRPFVEDNESEVGLLWIYLSSLATQARISEIHNDHWAAIISSLEPDVQEYGPRTRTLAIEAYALLGQPELASSLAYPLHRAGYRHPDFLRLIDDYPFLNPDSE